MDSQIEAVPEITLAPAHTACQSGQSAEIAKLACALVKAQALIRAAKKDGKNPHFGSRYSTLSEIWDVIREPLTANGLAVIQIPQPTQGQTVSLATMLVHESGQYITSVISMPLRPEFNKSGVEMGASPQQVGSCVTYARRYALSAMVGVASDDDDDGNLASKEPAAAAKADAAPAAAAPKADLKGKRVSAYPNENAAAAAADPAAKAAPVPDAKPNPKAAAPVANPAPPKSTRAQDQTAFHTRLYEACQAAEISPAQLEHDLMGKGILKGQMSLDNLGEPIVTALLDGKDKVSGRSNWDIVVERVQANKAVPF